MKKLTLPTIHMNGTSPEDLLDQNIEAGRAAQDLLHALQRAAPNARDYYVIGPEAFTKARNEHRDRAKRVQSVLDELSVIMEHVAEYT